MSSKPAGPVLIIGANGQLGAELIRRLSPEVEVVSTARAPSPHHFTLDVTDTGSIAPLFNELRPSLVINASAYTAVDAAENHEPLANAINGVAPRHLAEAAAAHDAPFVHFSTDYVFDGDKGNPYVETDRTAPHNVYGRSKAAGEAAVTDVGGAHLIIRTSALYGIRGHNFLLTMLRLGRERPKLSVVEDQVSSPTWVRPLADAVGTLLLGAQREGPNWWRAHSGLYHLAADGYCSWFTFARHIFDGAGYDTVVVPTSTEAYRAATPGALAPRPRFSGLDCEKMRATHGITLGRWETHLAMALDALADKDH